MRLRMGTVLDWGLLEIPTEYERRYTARTGKATHGLGNETNSGNRDGAQAGNIRAMSNVNRLRRSRYGGMFGRLQGLSAKNYLSML